MFTDKVFREGTHRTVLPNTTLSRIAPYFERLGITRIANVTGLDNIGIPVFTACRPNSKSLSVSQGKGLTSEAAKVSAAMESIELHHAESVNLPLVYGSYSELLHIHNICDVNQLASCSNSRFHPNLPILWIESRNLLDNKPFLVPFECVHATAQVPTPTGSGCFLSTSNGLASGNSYDEGIVHAICELIERDATALWEIQGAGREATRIDLRTVTDDGCGILLDRFAAAAVDVAVWETTSDVGVPSFICELTDRGHPMFLPRQAFTGMGCHTSKVVALCRSLTEAAQCRLTYISGSRDDLFPRDYARGDSLRPLYGDLALSGPSRSFADSPDVHTETIKGDVEILLAHLKNVGINEVLAVDLTKQEFRILVVRVIAPGLEGPDDDPDYRAGRRAQAANIS